MRRLKIPQANLFEPTHADSGLLLSQHADALRLLKALLMEAMLAPMVEIDVQAREGACDDEDRA